MPAVIHIHGGGWETGERGVAADAILPNHGFFYASIDYRLSPEAPFPAQLHDCKAAVRFLRAHAAEFQIDPSRIGVFGVSAGGHLAALLGLTAGAKELEGESGSPGVSSRVQAVLTMAGPTDFLDPDPRWREKFGPGEVLHRLFRADFGSSIEQARWASPLTYVGRDAPPPFLILHGDRDDVVPLHHAVRLHEALRAAGGETALWVYGGPHDLAEHWDDMRLQMLAFFRHSLGG